MLERMRWLGCFVVMLDLTGQVLIAMPGMGDPRFAGAVVLLCSHSPEGAMGLIVNKPSSDVRVTDLLSQLDLETTRPNLDRPVHFGGPVETSRGFVLHSPDYGSRIQTLTVTDGVAMTATLDILEDIARGTGPRTAMMLLGYAGWGPGQLEDELGRNGWLTAQAGAGLIFDTPDLEKWGAALKTLGIEPMMLSSSAGHA